MSIMFVCMHEVCVRMREYMYFSVLFVRPHSTKTGGVCACVHACMCTCDVEDQSCIFSWFLPLCAAIICLSCVQMDV